MQHIPFIKNVINELYYNLSVFVTLWLNYYENSSLKNRNTRQRSLYIVTG